MFRCSPCRVAASNHGRGSTRLEADHACRDRHLGPASPGAPSDPVCRDAGRPAMATDPAGRWQAVSWCRPRLHPAHAPANRPIGPRWPTPSPWSTLQWVPDASTEPRQQEWLPPSWVEGRSNAYCLELAARHHAGCGSIQIADHEVTGGHRSGNPAAEERTARRGVGQVVPTARSRRQCGGDHQCSVAATPCCAEGLRGATPRSTAVALVGLWRNAAITMRV